MNKGSSSKVRIIERLSGNIDVCCATGYTSGRSGSGAHSTQAASGGPWRCPTTNKVEERERPGGLVLFLLLLRSEKRKKKASSFNKFCGYLPIAQKAKKNRKRDPPPSLSL